MTSTASTSNPPLFLIPFGLQPASLPLQRPIRRFFSLLLDFSHGFHRVNVQSASFSRSFWTSACLPAASTSNPPLFLAPFGLSPWLPPRQRPIRLFFSFLLDFCLPPCRVNVQSAAFSRSFWTSTVTSTASTSNPPLFLTPFGLPQWLPPLQYPIRLFFSFLLDFCLPPCRVNVQSAAFSRSFWTFSMASTASTSSPPLFLTPFGLQPASQPLQRPINLSFSFRLDFLRDSLRFNVQSATFSCFPSTYIYETHSQKV